MRTLSRLLCSLAFAGSLFAQFSGPGSMELGGFVGATYGIGDYGVMGGGNFSYAINKYFLPYAEFSYFPSIERHFSGTIGTTSNSFSANYSLAATDFHGGIHIRFPVKESHFVPYAVFGVGRLGYSSSTVTINVPGANPVMVQSVGGGRAAINFGGGLRYYTKPHYGFRVEVKGYKPYGETAGGQFGYTNTFLKVEGGFFLQFK